MVRRRCHVICRQLVVQSHNIWSSYSRNITTSVVSCETQDYNYSNSSAISRRAYKQLECWWQSAKNEESCCPEWCTDMTLHLDILSNWDQYWVVHILRVSQKMKAKDCNVLVILNCVSMYWSFQSIDTNQLKCLLRTEMRSTLMVSHESNPMIEMNLVHILTPWWLQARGRRRSLMPWWGSSLWKSSRQPSGYSFYQDKIELISLHQL